MPRPFFAIFPISWLSTRDNQSALVEIFGSLPVKKEWRDFFIGRDRPPRKKRTPLPLPVPVRHTPVSIFFFFPLLQQQHAGGVQRRDSLQTTAEMVQRRREAGREGLGSHVTAKEGWSGDGGQMEGRAADQQETAGERDYRWRDDREKINRAPCLSAGLAITEGWERDPAFSLGVRTAWANFWAVLAILHCKTFDSGAYRVSVI